MPKMERMDLGVALAVCGGYGKYQTKLVFILIPITTSGVFCANAITFILPAIVCHLEISKYRQGFLYSAVYIGMVIGGFVWGVLADWLGRRKALILILGLTTVSEIVSAFTLTYWSLFFSKLCTGFTNCGILTTFFTYASEFIDGRNRDKMTMRIGCATALGYFIQPVLAVFTLPYVINFSILNDLINLNSWKLFILAGTLFPFAGFLVAVFILYESPAFLLRTGHDQEAMEIIHHIYTVNTGKPAETFPAENLYLKEDEEKIEKEKQSLQRGEKISWMSRISSEIKPLFHYPYLIPALMVFASQFITMAAYNSVRSHQSTIFAMALGIGQNQSTSNDTKSEFSTFCVLFEKQQIFTKETKCVQDTVTMHQDFTIDPFFQSSRMTNGNKISLNPKLYLCSAIIGFCIFISFIPAGEAVRKCGKKCVFLAAHMVCAVCISIIPWSSAVFTLFLMCIFSVCLQNCVAISIGLMLGRVPTSMRGITLSLIMTCGRFGVIVGSQILPVLTNISCPIGFISVACINMLAIPIIYIFSRQPNPLKEEGIKLLKELENAEK